MAVTHPDQAMPTAIPGHLVATDRWSRPRPTAWPSRWALTRLSPATHTLTVTLVDSGTARSGVGDEHVDRGLRTADGIVHAVAAATSVAASEGSVHSFLRDQFTMKLDPRDDQPGYVVAEFRVNDDGWHHYYGWPDAPPGTPFTFTPRGTDIKELVYGSLATEGLHRSRGSSASRAGVRIASSTAPSMRPATSVPHGASAPPSCPRLPARLW